MSAEGRCASLTRSKRMSDTTVPVTKRTPHRVILVIVGSHDALKAIEPLHHVHEAHEVALHFDGAVPGLERESRRPHRPKIRLEESLVEVVRAGARPEHVFRA